MSNEVIASLSEHENIIGIKDASNDLSRPKTLKGMITHKHFYQLSGEDETQLHFLAEGGDGVISVTANIAPELISQMHNLWNNDEHKLAIEINNKLSGLNKAMFVESNPCPVKFAAFKMGMCKDDLRLPLTKVSEKNQFLISKLVEELRLKF